MRSIATGLVLLLLSACTGLIETRDEVFNKGGRYYDNALVTAILWKCRAASVGSIERRYMRTDETWNMWTEECLSIGAPELPDRDEATVQPLPVPE